MLPHVGNAFYCRAMFIHLTCHQDGQQLSQFGHKQSTKYIYVSESNQTIFPKSQSNQIEAQHFCPRPHFILNVQNAHVMHLKLFDTKFKTIVEYLIQIIILLVIQV